MPKQKPNNQDLTSLHQKFELLVHNTEEPFVLIDANYTIITFNEQFKNQYLSFFGKEFLKGENILSYAQANSVELLKKMYQDVFNGQTFQSEIEVPFPDNIKRTFLNKYKPALNENGKIMGAFVSSTDITDKVISETRKKEAEEKLKESESNLRAIFNNSTDAFMLLDKDFKIKAFNSKANENQPYILRSLEHGASLLDYIEEERKVYFTDYLNRVLSAETIEYDTHYPEKDGGSGKWFHITLSPVKDDNIITGICITRRDVTEKKLIEENVRVAKERYDIVAKATNDAIYDWDLKNGEITRTGDGLKELFGYEPEDAAENDFWKKRIHPEDIGKATKKLELLLSQADKFYCNQEYRFLKADGTYAFVFDKGFIIRNSSGEAIRMIGATQDITHRKETELLLKNLNENLRARAKELADTNTELEQFAFIASHDLQEPLRMITSFLTQLELKYKDQLDDKAQQYIYFAIDGAARLRKIILDLLEYSLAGKKTIEVEILDTELVLAESLQLLRKTIEEKDAVIKYGPMPTLTANKSSLLQVFQNLISNGLKYQKAGQNPTIQINAIETDTHWQFSFSDNGIGVDEQFFEKIFVAFQRLHNRSEYAGTGLGLAICKKIIESHGGKIWLESKHGEGSTFYFTLMK